MKKTQFSLVLVNKPGELANLSKLLAKAEVNIEALAISDGIHTGVVKLVVDPPDPARAVFKEAGLQFSEQKVLAIPLPDNPGGLAELCAKLAKDGLSIDYVYGSTCTTGPDSGCKCQSQLMVSVANLAEAEAAVTMFFGGVPRP
jgi:hypothetical protein